MKKTWRCAVTSAPANTNTAPSCGTTSAVSRRRAEMRKFLDRIEHHFEQGGRYEKWYALYEAVDTFFYRPANVTRTTAHVRDGIDLKRMMITVWLCTFP